MPAGDDPLTEALTWIKLVGEPMRRDVEGLKRAFWWVGGGCSLAGVILGALAPFILRKLGWA